jgi:hypothetical protein
MRDTLFALWPYDRNTSNLYPPPRAFRGAGGARRAEVGAKQKQLDVDTKAPSFRN